jgi:hypothetical protein
MGCGCKAKRGKHSEWFKNLLKKKKKGKEKTMKKSPRPKRRGMSTGGYTGEMIPL